MSDPTGPFVTVTLLGPPRGKGRPRTRVIGKFATIFTDKKTRTYENDLKAAGIEAMGDRVPLDEAISVKVMAYMPVPESWSQKKKASALAGDIMPTSGIDLDNIVKMIDGLNYHPPQFKGDRSRRSIIWANDSQIVALSAMKFYSSEPRIEVFVWRWEE